MLALPQAREACPHNLAPTTSTLMQPRSATRSRSRCWKAAASRRCNFAELPSGRPARRHAQVRPRPHACGEQVPLDRSARDVRRDGRDDRPRASAASASSTADGQLAGIITDGDLRRHMRPDLLERAVDEVMTQEPQDGRPRPARLARRSRSSIRRRSRTLIVADADKPVGVVHMHDLLRAGVA